MRLYRARALAPMWRNSALSSSRVNSPLHISTSPSTSTVSTPEDRAVEDVVDGVHISVPLGRRYAWITMSARLHLRQDNKGSREIDREASTGRSGR